MVLVVFIVDTVYIHAIGTGRFGEQEWNWEGISWNLKYILEFRVYVWLFTLVLPFFVKLIMHGKKNDKKLFRMKRA